MTIEKEHDEHNILKAYNMMLYFAGTMIMYDPSHECIYDFWTQGMIKSLPVTSSNPEFLKAAAQLRNSIGDSNSSHTAMTDDFLKLFSGIGKPLAPPYESVYMSGERLLNGRKTEEVRHFYNSYGWESQFRDEIPDDHLGIELLFLTLMIEKYLELDDEACHTEMRNEIKRFMNEHILNWVPEWNQDVQEHARTLSYKGIASLVHACVKDIYGIMSQQKPLPQTCRS